MLALTLLYCFDGFGFILLGKSKYDYQTQRKTKCIEMIYLTLLLDLPKSNLGVQTSRIILSFYLFISVYGLANNIGLMAKVQTTNGYNLWTSPTANLGYDLSLSFLITLMTHVEGIRRRGVKEYLRAFVTPGL